MLFPIFCVITTALLHSKIFPTLPTWVKFAELMTPDFSPTDYVARISKELNISDKSVLSTCKLLNEGATVPFISRYRKEQTGSLDEVAITSIRDRMQQLIELERRRTSIISSLKERNLYTDKLKKDISEAQNLTKLEDLYAPFRPKRRTKATIAKDKGLEPLADFIVQNLSSNSVDDNTDPKAEASKFINTSPTEKDLVVENADDALTGARDIIAERFSDDADCKAELREHLEKTGDVSSKVLMTKKEDPAAQKFKDYFDFSEPLRDVPSHRMLAMRRGEKEGFLFMRISGDADSALSLMHDRFLLNAGSGACAEQVELAIADSYKRLISLSLETEFRMKAKKEADAEAVKVFTDNLRELLLASPLGQKNLLAIDPAFRTGCKTVVLDRQGNLLYDTVLHLTLGDAQAKVAQEAIVKLVSHFKIEAIAIGNGTASRESESAVRAIGLPKNIPILMVNESGASIYSASEVAREEFPDKDVTVRGAVSIGRRLMDPLAELVKIDPKSIGVGQYQHDVDQNMLKNSLDDTVISSVNGVGVELNTASKQLLSYVSGLNSGIAESIVAYRTEHGAFKTRDELKKVPRLGDKTFEQAAGFLRIHDAENPLDSSGVHPERYELVGKIADDLKASITELIKSDTLRDKINLHDYISDEVGIPTLQDILQELAKPGRDPRKAFEIFEFNDSVHKPEDLEEGMKLPGIVTNVTNFGAFVDVGVHQDGLVHISQLSDQFVSDPNDIVKVGQKVQVTVTEIDLKRNRIGLSMKSEPDAKKSSSGNNSSRGDHRGNNRNNRHNRHGSKPENNQFGGNWFDQAVQKGRK